MTTFSSLDTAAVHQEEGIHLIREESDELQSTAPSHDIILRRKKKHGKNRQQQEIVVQQKTNLSQKCDIKSYDDIFLREKSEQP